MSIILRNRTYALILLDSALWGSIAGVLIAKWTS
jgi:hypothetical protein